MTLLIVTKKCFAPCSTDSSPALDGPLGQRQKSKTRLRHGSGGNMPFILHFFLTRLPCPRSARSAVDKSRADQIPIKSREFPTKRRDEEIPLGGYTFQQPSITAIKASLLERNTGDRRSDQYVIEQDSLLGL